MMIVATTSIMIIVRTTSTAMTTTARNTLHHRRRKGATPTVHFKPPTERSTSLSVVANRPKATCSCDQTRGRSGTSTLKLHNLCIGRNTQSLFE
jgi:hypothetical protein